MLTMRRISWLFILLGLACSSGSTRPTNGPATAVPTLHPDSVAVLADGSVLVRSGDGAQCWLSRSGAPAVRLPFCGGFLRAIDGGALISDDVRSVRVTPTPDGLTLQPTPDRLLDATTEHEVVEKNGELVWRREGRPVNVGRADEWDEVRILADSDALVLMKRRPASIARISASARLDLLQEELAEIESIDIAPDEKELVLSARRKDNFDVGLLSTEGSRINWVVPDPLDEISVTWAPRGSKVTYQVVAPFGTILRSVHVPTSWQLAVDLPFSRVHALAWEPKAEKFAVVLSGAGHSPAAEWISFGGEVRSTISAPAARAIGEIEPFSDGVLVRPEIFRYNEKVPLILLVADDPLRWRRVTREARDAGYAVGLVTTQGMTQALSDLKSIGWVDRSRTVVIGRPADSPPLANQREVRFAEGGNEPRVVAAGDGSEVIEGNDRDAVESFAVARLLARLRPPMND